jgi:hypothetical protein
VLAGGSLAGKDSSSSSSSFSSDLAGDFRGGDFCGSFIPAAPWEAPPHIGREPAEARLERSGSLESRGDVQFHEVRNSARDSSFSTA